MLKASCLVKRETEKKTGATWIITKIEELKESTHRRQDRKAERTVFLTQQLEEDRQDSILTVVLADFTRTAVSNRIPNLRSS